MRNAEMSEDSAPGEELSATQRRYWNTVAGPRWVALGGFMEQRIHKVNDLLLASAAPQSGERVLEIGAGAGATTVLIAAAVGDRGRVLAVDISEPMLEAARRRLEGNAFRHVALVLADAATTEFVPESFDLAVSRFGVMFFADPTAAFRNLFAALRPGGRLVFSCWAALAENRHWLLAYEVVLRHLGPPAPQPPHAPGPLSLSDPDHVEKVLGDAGFEEIAIERKDFEVMGGSPAEETALAMTMGPSARLIDEKEAGEEVRERIRREMLDSFVAYGGEGPMALPARIFLVRARRPRETGP
jgi:SAM-dependent methyltransferase